MNIYVGNLDYAVKEQNIQELFEQFGSVESVKIINDKFIDGQLNECNLTLSDLHKIQESFVSDLMAIFHTRVAYPTKPDVKDAPDLFLNSTKNYKVLEF